VVLVSVGAYCPAADFDGGGHSLVEVVGRRNGLSGLNGRGLEGAKMKRSGMSYQEVLDEMERSSKWETHKRNHGLVPFETFIGEGQAREAYKSVSVQSRKYIPSKSMGCIDIIASIFVMILLAWVIGSLPF
jgi:hypothetical protein